jgi:hypothetical protein
MFQDNQTKDSPQIKINAEKQLVNRQNEQFRTRMVQLTIEDYKEKRRLIKEKCAWTRAVWFNKFHGITPLAPLEMEAIARILNTTVETLFN